MSAPIGVIGLGRVGGGIVARLAGRGRTLVVHDVRSAAMRAAAERHGTAVETAGSPAEVARRAGVVIVAVLDAEQVDDVLTGPAGLLGESRPGLVVAVMSTVAVDALRRWGSLAAVGDVRLIDCGITPGSKASTGEMVVMVGGDPADVATSRPVLDELAKLVIHCGPLGAGMTLKLARNVITYGAWRAVHEAASLVVASGLPVSLLTDVVAAADPGGDTLLRLVRTWPQAAPDETWQRLADDLETLTVKDLGAALELGETLGVALPLARVARDQAASTSHRGARSSDKRFVDKPIDPSVG
ncbi:MAG TPA: NAD(P)-dependent oxidoreductase [Ilumatobacter sp.]|nr:NAD(P)-dependent oxidoreductase [Ilumatobacter sp.]